MDEDFIPTRGSMKRQPNDFKIITFEAHKSKKKKTLTSEDKEEEVKKQHVELNMKKAKFEILKFGMAGFDAKKKQEAKVQLAIKLGAKPPKNKYRNYKDLLEEKKKLKEKEKTENDFLQLGKNCVGKSISKGKVFKKKKPIGLLDVYGKVTKVTKK